MNGNERRHQATVEIGGRHVYVKDEGPLAAPCIVFSHSIMTDTGMWQAQANALSQQYRVVRYDSRGHGETPPASNEYSTGILADDVIALIDALSLDKVHFVGLSLGGIVGFDLAHRYAHRLHSLVICDARPDSPSEFARAWDDRIAAASSTGMSALVEPTMARWFGPDFLETDAAQAIRAMIGNTSIEGFIATARALQTYDYRDAAAAISTPATFIAGEHDGVLPDIMRAVAQQCQAQFVLIPNAGHLPNIENTTAFNTALQDHLQRYAETNQ